MSVTLRFRRAVAARESGAVAIVVAISALVLFGVAALAIDIGQMYVRRSAAQLDADLAALAGAQGLPDQTSARLLAYNYIDENFPLSGGNAGALANFSDGNLSNGEIQFFNNNTRIKVWVPRTTVKFGLAGALGYSGSDVTAVATAEIQSPASLSPFMVNETASLGYLCLKDTSGGNPSAMRQSLLAAPPVNTVDVTGISPTSGSTLGGDSVVISGSNFDNVNSVSFDGVAAANFVVAGNKKSITVTTPAHVAGAVTVLVSSPANGSDTVGFTYTIPPPTPAPTVTGLSPSSGVLTGGTTVVITGTNLTGATAVLFGTTPATSFTVDSATQITAIAPAGLAGSISVTVVTPGGTSADTTADDYTYIADACDGSTGNFSFLHIPNASVTGANKTLQVNIIQGVDHTISTFPTAQLPAALNTQCSQGNNTIPGAILDTNCLDVQNGNKVSVTADAYLTGITNPNLTGKLKSPPSGHDTGTVFGSTNIDVDHIDEYLTVPVAQFVNALTAGSAPIPGWIKTDIVQCPRFSIVPILHTGPSNPPNGYYPIVGFRGIFIDGPAPDYGFVPNNNGTQIRAIKAYSFSLDYLPGVLSSSEVGDTTTYIGTGPKIPVLVE